MLFRSLDKLTIIDTNNDDGRLYRGYAGAELYLLNRDYLRTNKQKVYFHLGIEYDCCSECVEDYPHRAYYSEQSFQEELTDNYRAFLPNNYRDIEAEKGHITDVFRIQNNLYIHTVGALWHLPQNIQERVTGDIVSFIGTGSFFSVPPRKITDADKESSGTEHNWARMKTPNGTFFVSETEGKVFLFDGNSLNPISSNGNETWFKNNLPIKADYSSLITSGVPYPLRNNPSNLYGTGFISTYDTKKERFILTKKDFTFSDRITGSPDYNTCTQDGDFIIFDDYQETIDQYIADGWVYEGVEDCKMKFSKDTIETVTETREVIVAVPPNTVVVPFFDTTSMSSADVDNISATLDAWFPVFKDSVNGGDNEMTFVNPGTWNEWNTERWIKDPAQLLIDNGYANKDVLMLVFVDEANSAYHGYTMTSPMSAPTSPWNNDVNDFVTVTHSQFKSLVAINYPILKNGNGVQIDIDREYLQHAIAAIEAKNMSVAEVDNLDQNPLFTTVQWNTLKTNLQTNPYVGQPFLKDYGWLYKENRVTGIDNNGSPACPVDGVSVITPCQFTLDIEDLLNSSVTIVETEVEVEIVVKEVEYVEGLVIADPIDYDNSWTMSYSLKDKEWVSWHSYIPNFYIYRLEEFYSWVYGDYTLYKHNRLNHYQTFYGVKYPHIIEFVDNKKPMETKTWDFVLIQSEAHEFNPTYQEYVDRDITFNKLIAYTSKQSTGLLNVINKEDGEDYFTDSIVNKVDEISISRGERDWLLNDLRDVVVDYNIPFFRKDDVSLKSEYFIDKIVNNDALDYNKDWDDLQSFRDKYLVLRLIFDNFDNIRLVTNFTEEMDNKSSH